MDSCKALCYKLPFPKVRRFFTSYVRVLFSFFYTYLKKRIILIFPIIIFSSLSIALMFSLDYNIFISKIVGSGYSHCLNSNFGLSGTGIESIGMLNMSSSVFCLPPILKTWGQFLNSQAIFQICIVIRIRISQIQG